MPINPSAHDSRMGKLKKGQSIQREWDHESHGYWQETMSSMKDKRSQLACAACGKPGGQNLKMCSGCRAILYHSAEHQKMGWDTYYFQWRQMGWGNMIIHGDGWAHLDNM
ncbi:hypothetical protein BDR06DRAFT_966906 [Suillus hirtellus]|nr:hypothetical protein BDR06DRAFT_966906 [Suillus hirtellus]